MKIRDHVNSPEFANDIPSIRGLLEKAQGKVSFWGTRVITVKGYEGSIALDALARKVFVAGKKRSVEGGLTEQERAAEPKIMNKLNRLYRDTDTQISKSHWFTRLLSWARECGPYPYTRRFYVENGILFL